MEKLLATLVSRISGIQCVRLRLGRGDHLDALPLPAVRAGVVEGAELWGFNHSACSIVGVVHLVDTLCAGRGTLLRGSGRLGVVS